MTDARVTEAFVSDLTTGPAAEARVTEAFASALVTGPAGSAHVTEAFVTTLAYMGPCGTQRCDLWKITRRDGVVFAFTSLDTNFVSGGVTYKHCASLSDSASESSSELGSVGSVSITGLLDDESITEADLYAGLFDDAFFEAWVVSWKGVDLACPFRAAAGWLGKVDRGQNSWSADVDGPGARLMQTALVEFYTPGCRWKFGDAATCDVNAEALAVFGCNVTKGVQRYAVYFDASEPVESAIWNGGTVRWTYGANAGVECQVDTVDWGSQLLSLWDLAPFPPAVGDSFDLLPGCPKDGDSCKLYANYINFGGFPDVPGPDALQQNADSLYTGSNG
jgi:uncharacterized phage protein (TIGR02218 family)